jgi:hypothetical protein
VEKGSIRPRASGPDASGPGRGGTPARARNASESIGSHTRAERLKALRVAAVLAVLFAIWVLLTVFVGDFPLCSIIPFFGFILLVGVLDNLLTAIVGEEDTSPGGD